jgi:rubredoxin
LLIELSKLYFRQLNPDRETADEVKPELLPENKATAYQCPNCLTMYDERYGDLASGIPEGTKFENLPEVYCCHVCNSPKRYFEKVQL